MRIIAYILSLLILVSTTGLTINKHYCCGKLIDTKVLWKADSCGMKKMSKSKCCGEEATLIKVDDQSPTYSVDFQSTVLTFIAILPPIFVLKAMATEVSFPSFFHYKPPLILRDNIVENQAFLC